MELYSGTTKSAENDNWGTQSGTVTAATIQTSSASLGAFPLTTGSKDAALLPSLATGGYSVQVSGVANTTGVALVEVYDADTSVLSAAARLSNLSARTQVGTGADILFAGFTLTGTGTQRVLIRAVGPTLSAFNVPGVLADPILEVYAGSTRVASNDNWGTQTGTVSVASIQTAATAVGAFPLTTTTKDSVLLLTLSPGGYTVQVSGLANSTGVALVEIYEVP